MEKNIFEGAKFGDKFVTRDGRIAIFLNPHRLAIDTKSKDSISFPYYTIDGENTSSSDRNLDIVSRYQEPIDNTKLEILIDKNVPKSPFFSTLDYDNWSDGFIAGYKQRAKEE